MVVSEMIFVKGHRPSFSAYNQQKPASPIRIYCYNTLLLFLIKVRTIYDRIT